MTSNIRQQFDFIEIIVRMLDGAASEEELRYIEKTLQEGRQMRQLYLLAVETHSLMKYPGKVFAGNAQSRVCEDSLSAVFWKELLTQEKNAPAVILPREEPPTPPIVSPAKTGKISHSRFTIGFLAAAASFIVFVLTLHFLPRPETGAEVATLNDSMKAVWPKDSRLEPGARLTAGSGPIRLSEGLVQIEYDNKTMLVIEAPAEFSILTHDQVILSYGKLYARVPEQAYGFTVCTPVSKIIDLGTEFGVVSSSNGNTELHVMKGKANLVSGYKGHKINREVGEGNARMMSPQFGDSEIPVNEQLFARQIHSASNVIVREKESIDLADIAGGGNGFGTGGRGMCINPVTGELMTSRITVEQPNFRGRQNRKGYKKLEWSRVIDGVFVPNAAEGPVVISSRGHVFREAPETQSIFWDGIINSGKILGRDVVLDGITIGTPQRPFLFMHSNIGITFDLDEARKLLPGRTISAFRSRFGVSEAYPDKTVQPHADFWVLVDGELRFSRKNVTIHETGDIEIPLSPDDRFLTLAATEGEDIHGNQNAFNDWCLFESPVLTFDGK